MRWPEVQLNDITWTLAKEKNKSGRSVTRVWGRGELLNFSGFLRTECKDYSVAQECSAKGIYRRGDF